jgi:hypothetical protein
MLRVPPPGRTRRRSPAFPSALPRRSVRATSNRLSSAGLAGRQLGRQVDDIAGDAVPFTWTDRTFACGDEAAAGAPAPVSGYKLLLRGGDQVYVYHPTSRPCFRPPIEQMAASPATPLPAAAGPRCRGLRDANFFECSAQCQWAAGERRRVLIPLVVGRRATASCPSHPIR